MSYFHFEELGLLQTTSSIELKQLQNHSHSPLYKQVRLHNESCKTKNIVEMFGHGLPVLSGLGNEPQKPCTFFEPYLQLVRKILCREQPKPD
jgi:hypothetical protein